MNTWSWISTLSIAPVCLCSYCGNWGLICIYMLKRGRMGCVVFSWWEPRLVGKCCVDLVSVADVVAWVGRYFSSYLMFWLLFLLPFLVLFWSIVIWSMSQPPQFQSGKWIICYELSAESYHTSAHSRPHTCTSYTLICASVQSYFDRCITFRWDSAFHRNNILRSQLCQVTTAW